MLLLLDEWRTAVGYSAAVKSEKQEYLICIYCDIALGSEAPLLILSTWVIFQWKPGVVAAVIFGVSMRFGSTGTQPGVLMLQMYWSFRLLKADCCLCRWHELECSGMGPSSWGAHLGTGESASHHWSRASTPLSLSHTSHSERCVSLSLLYVCNIKCLWLLSVLHRCSAWMVHWCSWWVSP